MLYRTYQLRDDIAAATQSAAMLTLPFLEPQTWGFQENPCSAWEPTRKRMSASLQMAERCRLTHSRPDFDIPSVLVDGVETDVVEELAASLPFGNLVHFKKDFKQHNDVPQPKVLVVAALSGHFATLLRDTIETLLADHDVYVTDWLNARDVPSNEGPFGVDDYVTYLIDFLEEIGPGAHIVAVCQPCVQALAAVAVMNENNNPAAPLSMTLMGGPIDVRENPTAVNELATSKPMSWFEKNVITTVPRRFPGGGRRVYPGFLQLTGFIQMNAKTHIDQQIKLWRSMVSGDDETAEGIKDFYDEYFAVLDLTAEFYLETIDRVFQKAELARGEFVYKGKLVDPSAITKTALLTVEGERDDICSVGQTSAAHELCSSLRPHLKRHHLQSGVGHYGVFSGSRWRNEIYPVVENFILSTM